MEYTLQKGGATAIASTQGGELISYRCEGTEYVWTGDSNYWPGHAPLLFPVVGQLIGGKVKIEGKEYTMNKHGFARGSKFTLVESGDSHVVFELRDSAETRVQYPYPFRLRVTHTLLDNGFETKYDVTNPGDSDIRFCIGGHPGFRCPLGEGEAFSDYRLVFEKPELPRAYYTDADTVLHRDLIQELSFTDPQTWPLCYDSFARDALIFDGLASRKVSLLRGDKGLEFSFFGFQVLGVWTPPGKQAPFLCLEPWAGLPALSDEDGNLESKPYVVTLAGGSTYSAGYSMAIQ